ncbi:hypothetical protein P171DRAFT_521729 [Karstenula rhodostoma CBS 690.94]|uniref:Uncharacterized protein n=1 Tax=Karstenula rhodostoma CBS 690.94 TaxID=1392251 RepID=A0A9P4PHS2_9PLEO|nr:hypothetical protein P171DRAFT_521729 [Karstenula rhodostoma CBS 690.94]
MPGSLDHVSLVCAGRNTTELPQCLSNALGVSYSTRGVDEVWIRFLAVLVATMASCGHLMSLQGSANSVEALLVLLCFFEFPEMALAQIVIRATIAVRRVLWSRGRLSARFFIAACLGMQASSVCSPNKAVPLVSLRPEQVHRVPQRIGILWIGRLGLLLAFLAQYIGTVSIWVRGVFNIQDRGIWFWLIDLRIFRIALGGLVATLNSTLILSIGSEWKMIGPHDHDASPHPLERSDTSSTLCSNEQDNFLKLPLEGLPSERSESRLRSHDKASLFARCKAFNKSFTKYLDSVFPVLRQSDLELGIIIHRVWIYGITIYILRYRFTSGCPPILHFLTEATSTFDWTKVCPDHTNIWDATTFSLSTRDRDHTRYGRALQISNILFNIGVGRIVVQWAFTLIAQLYEKIRKPAPKEARSFERWFLSGRSIICFPLLILLFACSPVTIMTLVESRGWIKNAQTVLQSPGIGETDRLAMGVLMWKDPWHDSLYLI